MFSSYGMMNHAIQMNKINLLNGIISRKILLKKKVINVGITDYFLKIVLD